MIAKVLIGAIVSFFLFISGIYTFDNGFLIWVSGIIFSGFFCIPIFTLLPINTKISISAVVQKKKIRLGLIFCSLVLIGGFIHEIKMSGGLLSGHRPSYVSRYNDIYNWSKDYAGFKTGLKGYFPETDCGDIDLKYDSDGKYIVGPGNEVQTTSRCQYADELSSLLENYLFDVGDPRADQSFSSMSLDAQVGLFNQLKKEGVFQNVKQKETHEFHWNNILILLFMAVIMPIIICFCYLYFLLRKNKEKEIMKHGA